jgi:wyosine [tRNA(Phe)-imidazoG37] synthetase (radical SAM superfamily)
MDGYAMGGQGMKEQTLQCVFGPVPSRRLGRSLGVDLVPFKFCPYDCIYCQLGRTTKRTTERVEYLPLESVMSDLDKTMQSVPVPDVITLSGSGEPTLHSRLGKLISWIKRQTGLPLAVLTNGSLLWDPRVREDLADADIVLPSLDAGDKKLFHYVNRPHPSIGFQKMIQGLEDFRREFSGKVWLEVFLLAGVTGIESEVAKIARIARKIAPDRVQLNTVTRPPAEQFAYPVSPEQMQRLAAAFGGLAEVLGYFQAESRPIEQTAGEQAILELLGRRPCTVSDIADGLSLHPIQVLKLTERLMQSGKASSTCLGRETFYLSKEQ